MTADDNIQERYHQQQQQQQQQYIQQRLHEDEENRLLSPSSAKRPRQGMVYPNLQHRRRSSITDSNKTSPPGTSNPYNTNISPNSYNNLSQKQQLRYQELMMQRRTRSNAGNLQHQQQQPLSSQSRDNLLEDLSSPQGSSKSTTSSNNERYWQKEIFIPFEQSLNPNQQQKQQQQQQQQEPMKTSPLSPVIRQQLMNKLHNRTSTLMQNQYRAVRDLMLRNRQQQQNQSSPVINKMVPLTIHGQKTDNISINTMKRRAPKVFCNTCKGDALFLCSGCRKKWYCSRECQVTCFLFIYYLYKVDSSSLKFNIIVF